MWRGCNHRTHNNLGDLLTIVKRRKLQWYGYVSRSSGLAETILQGTVKGGRRQGRQRKRWEDNIREWTVLEFGKPQRAVENREKWRKLVAKSSVVPQRPSRLRNWWWRWVAHKALSQNLLSASEIALPRSIKDGRAWSWFFYLILCWNMNNSIWMVLSFTYVAHWCI